MKKGLKSQVLVVFLFGLMNVFSQSQDLALVVSENGQDVSESTPAYLAYNMDTENELAVADDAKQGLEVYFIAGRSGAEEINLSAYPNASSNSLTLNMGNSKRLNVGFQLYDTQGELLRETAINDIKTDISLQNLNPAIYLGRVIQNKKEVKTFKIIKR